jgi:hypothetical protein
MPATTQRIQQKVLRWTSVSPCVKAILADAAAGVSTSVADLYPTVGAEGGAGGAGGDLPPQKIATLFTFARVIEVRVVELVAGQARLVFNCWARGFSHYAR